jgi:hypothetical protein
MLTFDARDHVYRFDGQKIPSVTQIIKGAGLMGDFSDALGDAMNAAATRGTFVHKAVELDLDGDLDESSLRPDILESVNVFRTARAELGIKPLRSEFKVFHPVYRYAGTVDLLATIAGTVYVIDLKNGALAEWHRIQTAMYFMGLDGMALHGVTVDGKAGLHSHLIPEARASLYIGGGKYRIIEHKDRSDFAVAKSAITIYNWKKENGIL